MHVVVINHNWANHLSFSVLTFHQNCTIQKCTMFCLPALCVQGMNEQRGYYFADCQPLDVQCTTETFLNNYNWKLLLSPYVLTMHAHILVYRLCDSTSQETRYLSSSFAQKNSRHAKDPQLAQECLPLQRTHGQSWIPHMLPLRAATGEHIGWNTWCSQKLWFSLKVITTWHVYPAVYCEQETRIKGEWLRVYVVQYTPNLHTCTYIIGFKEKHLLYSRKVVLRRRYVGYIIALDNHFTKLNGNCYI